MKNESNKCKRGPLSTETDKHLVKFLLSPFSNSATGIKSYKLHHGISFPESSKQVSNRSLYLKKLQQTEFEKFAKLASSFGIISSVQEDHNTDSDTSYSDDSDYEIDLISNNFKQPINNFKSKIINTTNGHSLKKKPTQKMKQSSFEGGMRQHQKFLNLEHPHLNHHGMMWYRDDDVEIDDSYYSVLTIYQPLFDARDSSMVKLFLDDEDPSVLHHVHPNLPTYFFQDIGAMHKQEMSPNNPELYSFTAKKHKKTAHTIVNSDGDKLQMSNYTLPFNLSLGKFDLIINSKAELEKHYRTVEHVVDVQNKITHKGAYLYWKVLIDGEATHFLSSGNHYAAAEARRIGEDPPGIRDLFVGGGENFMSEDIPEHQPSSFIPEHQSSSHIPEHQPSSFTPFVGDVVEPDDQTSNPVVTNTVLSDHIARLGRYVIGANQHPPQTTSNKKPKLNNFKPMDEEEIKATVEDIYPDL